MKSVLFLFDINGTLIKRDERTDIPFEIAVNKTLNIENCLENINTSARSDKDVFMEILEKKNISFADSLWQRFMVNYKQILEEYYKTDVWRENDIACQFVRSIDRIKCFMALVTGELSVGAEYKLKKIELWDEFITGGFGEDSIYRKEIAEKAILKAEKINKQSFEDIFLVGDTVLDIKVAKSLGIKIISIATGSNSYDELEKYAPNYLIRGFNELYEIKDFESMINA